jgi:hypothetical protein
MIVIDQVSNVKIEIGRASQFQCILSEKNEDGKEDFVTLFRSDWEMLKKKIDKMFELVKE